MLRAVTYASLFDYPLSPEQVRSSLPGVRATIEQIVAWWKASSLLQTAIDYRDGYFFPAGRGDLLRTRTHRESVSRDLLKRDGRILAFIARTPFVRMVALSGSLAHLNADSTADLDLFVITAPNRVWSVTVFLLVMAKLRGWRQRLCLNYIVSEHAMQVEPRDLFSANQVIHLRPLCGEDVYDRFVKSNAFVRDFYPNFETGLQPVKAGPRPSRFIERLLNAGIAQAAESACRALYGWHLRRKAATWLSRDQVRLEPDCLKLHTTSHRAATMERFEAAMNNATTIHLDHSEQELVSLVSLPRLDGPLSVRMPR